jgi:Holliday junction resolvase RusA-like endonuclease
MPPPTGRGRLNSKRKLDSDSTPVEPKTPRLDSNVVFEQLKGSEESLNEIRKTLSDAVSVGESCYSANDGGMGEAFFKLAKTVDLLMVNQEKLLSTLVDTMGLVGSTAPISSYASAAARGKKPLPRDPSSRREDQHNPDFKAKKLRQAITRAERSVTLFDLDLGPVPVLNRDTLSRKVTLHLHDRAQSQGIYKGNPAAAEEAIDDILSCATIDILGKGSQTFYNKKDTGDARNGKMCTVPVKLTFRDKATRFQAELTLKKACKVKCSTPYPKQLRTIMDDLVKVCKPANSGCFILTRVDMDKLTVTARARTDKGWKDLDNTAKIPLDILDPAEMAAADDEVIDMTPVS